MSALLRDDQPKISKSPASSNNSFENIRLVCCQSNNSYFHTAQNDFIINQFSFSPKCRPSYPHIYEQNVLSRPLFHPFPLFAMLQQQGQQQQQNSSLPR